MSPAPFPFNGFLRKQLSKIREINQKYAVPRIKTSGAVGFALVFLRFYLFLLVGILLFKFITLLHP